MPPGLYFMAGALCALVAVVLFKVVRNVFVFRSPRVPIDRDPDAPFFGSNALPWFLSLTFVLVGGWLLSAFLGPLIEPYIRIGVNFILKELGLA